MNTAWEQLGIVSAVVAQLKSNGAEQPTEVQQLAIPAMLDNRDITARSQTGSGKTLAYVLPALQRVDVQQAHLQVVIVAPTQELAMQIFRVAALYGETLNVRVQQLIGGASVQRQLEKLKERPHLVVGTPGRLHELATSGKLKLHLVKLLIIDEADQVFQLGSTKEIEYLIKGMDRARQMAFFSATRPPVMATIEQRYMQQPVTVDTSDQRRLPAQVEHYYLVSERRDKVDTVRRLLRLLQPKSALLFINETDEIANLEAKLSYEGFATEMLYGDANKQQRSATLARFSDGRCEVLIATDVAARGLDIQNLPLVIHFDVAPDTDHYVHRSGRTGRMGRPGTVVSIITPRQQFIMEKFAQQLAIELLERKMSHGKLFTLAELESYKPEPIVRKPAAKTEAPAERPPQQRSPKSAPPQPVTKKPKVKSKDKGAPKWLKAKRDQQ